MWKSGHSTGLVEVGGLVQGSGRYGAIGSLVLGDTGEFF